MKGKVAEAFKRITSASPKRSVFNLTHSKKYTLDMGQLFPILVKETIPGDVWDMSAAAIIRMQPMVAPVLHTLKSKTWFFFVPFRLLDTNWETFIFRGEDGLQEPTLPTWDPDAGARTFPADHIGQDKLWDAMGLPLALSGASNPLDLAGSLPLDYYRRAYYFIWNEYFRNQNFQTELDIDDAVLQYEVKRKNWIGDYFTTALPWTQRGTAPILPVTGTVDFTLPYADYSAVSDTFVGIPVINQVNMPTGAFFGTADHNTGSGDMVFEDEPDILTNWGSLLSDNNSIDASSVDINSLRLSFQIQSFLEKNATSGVRYTEGLKAHFGVSPTDARLQRPEYIGGSVDDVMISEVVKTSESGTDPQGHLAGYGISLQSGGVARYRTLEHGCIIGLHCVEPNPVYQQGMDRQYLRRTNYDFPWPLFANLGEQEVLQSEILLNDTAAENISVFGYTGRYNELRYFPNTVATGMRETYDYWHISRQFDSDLPLALDSAFLECNPRKDFLAAPSEPAMIVEFGNQLQVMRPIPFIAEPFTFKN